MGRNGAAQRIGIKTMTTIISDALDAAIDVKISRGQKAAATRRANAINAPLPTQDNAEISLVQQVFNAAYQVGEIDSVLKMAVIAAGFNQEDVRNMAIAGRIAQSLKINQDKALIVLGKTGNPKHKTYAGDDVRTIAEEKAYGAARVWWSARLKAWDLKTTATTGGDRTKGDEDADAMNTEKLVLPKKVKVETTIELGAFLLANAQSLYDFFLLNATHPAVTSDQGSEFMGACADFLDAVRTIQKGDA
jgi:hypothetical protein